MIQFTIIGVDGIQPQTEFALIIHKCQAIIFRYKSSLAMVLVSVNERL